jgi:hypothetical protein
MGMAIRRMTNMDWGMVSFEVLHLHVLRRTETKESIARASVGTSGIILLNVDSWKDREVSGVRCVHLLLAASNGLKDERPGTTRDGQVEVLRQANTESNRGSRIS